METNINTIYLLAVILVAFWCVFKMGMYYQIYKTKKRLESKHGIIRFVKYLIGRKEINKTAGEILIEKIIKAFTD